MPLLDGHEHGRRRLARPRAFAHTLRAVEHDPDGGRLATLRDGAQRELPLLCFGLHVLFLCRAQLTRGKSSARRSPMRAGPRRARARSAIDAPHRKRQERAVVARIVRVAVPPAPDQRDRVLRPDDRVLRVLLVGVVPGQLGDAVPPRGLAEPVAGALDRDEHEIARPRARPRVGLVDERRARILEGRELGRERAPPQHGVGVDRALALVLPLVALEAPDPPVEDLGFAGYALRHVPLLRVRREADLRRDPSRAAVAAHPRALAHPTRHRVKGDKAEAQTRERDLAGSDPVGHAPPHGREVVHGEVEIREGVGPRSRPVSHSGALSKAR